MILKANQLDAVELQTTRLSNRDDICISTVDSYYMRNAEASDFAPNIRTESISELTRSGADTVCASSLTLESRCFKIKAEWVAFCLFVLTFSGCSTSPVSLRFPIDDEKCIVVSQTSDRILASFEFSQQATPPCQIRWLPHGNIEESFFRLLVLPQEEIVLLLENREFFNTLPAVATREAWAEIVINECLLFVADTRQNSASCFSGYKDTKRISVSLGHRENEVIEWITRLDLHATLDAATAELLMILPKLDTLVVGNQVVTSDGIQGLARVPSLSLLNVAHSLTDDASLRSLREQIHIRKVLVNAQQASWLLTNPPETPLPFELEVVSTD